MENNNVYLNVIPKSGEITLLAAVVDKENRPKRNGGSYLAFRLADRSGELDAKVWDNPEAVFRARRFGQYSSFVASSRCRSAILPSR